MLLALLLRRRGRPCCRLFSANTPVGVSMMKKRKQNAALVIGYIGDDFRGLQKQPGTDVKTVEDEVERALYDVGCIRDSNFGHLDKIGWSRSSRTDAGVHSTGTVCSAKLLLHDGEIAHLPARLNERLPETVRVLAAELVPKSWRARLICSRRTYEYLIPADCSFKDTPDVRRALAAFVGPANVHNFSNTRANRAMLTALPFTLSEDEVAKLDPQQMEALHFQRNSSLNREILSLSMDEVTIRDKPFWRLRFVGASFAYNQIRLIVGAIVGVSIGILDADALPAAYRGPFRLHVPLAPPGHLLLTYEHGSFPNWRQGLQYLSEPIEQVCDDYKRTIYDWVASTTTLASFEAWIDEQRADERIRSQAFPNIIKRFEEWRPIYSDKQSWSKRRRLTLLSKWLPDTREPPPPLIAVCDAAAPESGPSVVVCA
ncbi:unnamed protein product (mitochondrion) [Plasmodiophora brassicae]|uniref:tRNA pseudouridine synthase n=1 Tax=Plasmodiophora brassicae TaxID=37360 RepID=A0A0G4IQQ3_PLABS|nr:hypothetical protein PBRA_000911 [Plasmodiophora brassicae]SPQ97868.1 unnamed protein product [Plasmodiophora brassicae]